MSSLTVFRSHLRAEAAVEYEQWAARVEKLAATMPGFESIKTFTADDGERVSLVLFRSHAEAQAWREHPEHLEAQRLGRERFYSEYNIQVASVERSFEFPG